MFFFQPTGGEAHGCSPVGLDNHLVSVWFLHEHKIDN